MRATILLFVVGAFASCDKDPDHTNEALFYQSCKAGEAFVINEIQVNNDDGTTNYPVNVDASLNIVVNFTNTASHSWDNVVAKADISRYTDIFGHCSWIGIPTFGLTDHLDGCNFLSQPLCPIPPGVSLIKDKVDLQRFQAILNILNVDEPYRVTLSFKSGDTELACAIIETKIRKGGSG
uniref:MD-2-related lipid-recognition domain-containing protein n=1 Tax=Plectus sambesii TaxID=2011161 RepID=A0A914WI87_9BILA